MSKAACENTMVRIKCGAESTVTGDDDPGPDKPIAGVSAAPRDGAQNISTDWTRLGTADVIAAWQYQAL